VPAGAGADLPRPQPLQGHAADRGGRCLHVLAQPAAILALCAYATTRSLGFFDRQVLMWWALITPVAAVDGGLGRAALPQRGDPLPGNRRAAVVIGAGPLGVKVANALREP
jgi:hypothetical protein